MTCTNILTGHFTAEFQSLLGLHDLEKLIGVDVNSNFTIHQIQKRRIRSGLIALVREANPGELLALQNFIEYSTGFDLPLIYII